MNSKKLKILFFVTEDWFVFSHWLPLIEGAKNADFEVVVVTQTNNHAHKIQQNGIKLIPFKILRNSINIFREVLTILRLIKIYHEEQPDIVHHVAMKPMLYGSFVSKIMGVKKTVNWVAGMGWMAVSNSWKARILQFLVRKVLGILLRGTLVIVENKDDYKIIAKMGVSRRHIQLIRGVGVDTLLYKVQPEIGGIPLVMFPARMLWDKGIREFVDAARQLQQRGIQARFALVGDSDEQNPASVPEQQLIDWQKEGIVDWWGRREDMPYALAQSHIVCLPSYREGMPKSLLEAASCGRSIVTTDVPGCREIVCDGDNGFLVEARNANALADALTKLIVSPELRQKMGKRGRELVLSEFSQERVIAQVLALYRDALS